MLLASGLDCGELVRAALPGGRLRVYHGGQVAGVPIRRGLAPRLMLLRRRHRGVEVGLELADHRRVLLSPGAPPPLHVPPVLQLPLLPLQPGQAGLDVLQVGLGEASLGRRRRRRRRRGRGRLLRLLLLRAVVEVGHVGRPLFGALLLARHLGGAAEHGPLAQRRRPVAIIVGGVRFSFSSPHDLPEQARALQPRLPRSRPPHLAQRRLEFRVVPDVREGLGVLQRVVGLVGSTHPGGGGGRFCVLAAAVRVGGVGAAVDAVGVPRLQELPRLLHAWKLHLVLLLLLSSFHSVLPRQVRSQVRRQLRSPGARCVDNVRLPQESVLGQRRSATETTTGAGGIFSSSIFLLLLLDFFSPNVGGGGGRGRCGGTRLHLARYASTGVSACITVARRGRRLWRGRGRRSSLAPGPLALGTAPAADVWKRLSQLLQTVQQPIQLLLALRPSPEGAGGAPEVVAPPHVVVALVLAVAAGGGLPLERRPLLLLLLWFRGL